ncbi:MAG: signal peptidase I [SAR202 cluster bacterium]|nr:signal peptidase I [SAR202 cluster bacterium]MDP6714299.1 signal peptidase I [SAR202 cluster bacterium]
MTAIAQRPSSVYPSKKVITPDRVVLLAAVLLYLGLAIYSQSILPLRLTKGTSMEPAFHQGDVILVKKVSFSDIEVGDVVAFRTPEVFVGVSPGTILHRVTDIGVRDGQLALSTKGDNSDIDPFPVRPADVRGKAILRVKYIGWPVVFMTSRQGILFISIATLLTLLYIPAFIIFYATVIRRDGDSEETALAVRSETVPSLEALRPVIDYSELQDSLSDLSDRIDRMHSRGHSAGQQHNGRMIDGPANGRPTHSNVNNGDSRPESPDRNGQATQTISRDRSYQINRPPAPIARASRSQQTFVSLPERDQDHLGLKAGIATESPDQNHRPEQGTNGHSTHATMNKPEIQLFEQYRPTLRPSEKPHAVDASGVAADELQALALKVVEAETPVHVLDLRREIRDYLGANGNTETLGVRLDAAIEFLVSKRKIRRELASGARSARGQFLTSPRFVGDAKPWRGARRDISRVSDAELRAGLLKVAWAMYSASPGPLMAETAKQFGFAKTDVKVTSRIKTSISRLVQEGKLSADARGTLRVS